MSIGDTDFHGLDVARPIVITATLGNLPDSLKDLDVYGEYLRGYDAASGHIEDEPREDLETVLTVRLRIEGDLEPSWSLYSERAEQQGLERSLRWQDRKAIAPARVGTYAIGNLSWTRGSVLNRLTDERANLGVELARAARNARASFGAQAADQLADALRVVTDTANNLGVPVGPLCQYDLRHLPLTI